MSVKLARQGFYGYSSKHEDGDDRHLDNKHDNGIKLGLVLSVLTI